MEPSIPSVDELLASASKYAQRAVDAHNSQEYELLAIFAATALEHITKACLIRRHPVLLLNLQGKDSWKSLLFLVGTTSKRPDRLLTVGLRDALIRVKDLFDSNANQTDLLQLIDIRDGAVHVARNIMIEERQVIAFLRQIDASLDDLRYVREKFWNSRLGVVEAILSEEADRVKRGVGLKIQQAKVKFELNLAPYSADIKQAIVATIRLLRDDEASCICPACGSLGIAVGDKNFSLIMEEESPSVIQVRAIASFKAASFTCNLCGLSLVSSEEMAEAKMDLEWDFDVDANDFSPRIEMLNYE